MSKPNEERDIYYIPPNFLASGRLFGGMIRARNAIEACVLVLLTGILLNIDRFPILILLAFEPLIRRGMLPLLLMEPASAWPWQKWSKRSWLSAVSVIVGAVLP